MRQSIARAVPILALLTIAACTTGQVLGALDLIAEKVKCGIANQDLPNEQILAKCAVQEGDAQRVLALVAESRRVSAEKVQAAKVEAALQRAGACAPDAGGR